MLIVQAEELAFRGAAALTAHFDRAPDSIELEVEFSYEGYYLPARLSGDPDRRDPEESDEERLIVSVSVAGQPIPAAILRLIEAELQTRVDDLEFDPV